MNTLECEYSCKYFYFDIFKEFKENVSFQNGYKLFTCLASNTQWWLHHTLKLLQQYRKLAQTIIFCWASSLPWSLAAKCNASWILWNVYCYCLVLLLLYWVRSSHVWKEIPAPMHTTVCQVLLKSSKHVGWCFLLCLKAHWSTTKNTSADIFGCFLTKIYTP